MIKLDLKKDLKPFYSPSAKAVTLIEVPRFKFIMLDGAIEAGQGPSDSPEFQEGVQAMYGLAYTLKFNSKLRKDDPIDYPVMALEGLWWVEGGEFDYTRKENWRWTLMILLPDLITRESFDAAQQQLKKKRPSLAVTRLRMEEFTEGLSVQRLHVGPYSTEPETIARLVDFTQRNGMRINGRHHEIYMGDPRRSAPEKLKTILRYPVVRG